MQGSTSSGASVKWSDQIDNEVEESPSQQVNLNCNTINESVSKTLTRAAQTIKKHALRTSRHIICFFQLYIKYDKDITLPVVVDASQTIEYLRALIEAVYAFNFTYFASDFQKLDSTLTIQNVPPKATCKLPLVVELLCNKRLETLNFDAIIEDVLQHGDTVVVGAGHSFPLHEAITHEGIKMELTLEPPSVYTTPTGSISPKLSTPETNLDQEFLAILHNRKWLCTFKDFCVSKTIVQDLLFWMDVEVFNSISEEWIPSMGKYIFATYISATALMKINLSNEVKTEIIRLAKSSHHLNAFDEAQILIYDSLKCVVFPRFKETQEYLLTNRLDVDAYQISVPFATYFPPDPCLFDEIAVQYEKYSDVSLPIYLREMYLNRVLNRYFPEAEPTLGYFESILAVDQQQRALKLQREKKLRKFFGMEGSQTREGTGILVRQLQTPIVDLTLKLNHRDGEEILEEVSPSSVTSNPESTDILSPAAPNNIFQKKKRVDKLESFFGVKPTSFHSIDPSLNSSDKSTSRLVRTNSLPELVNQNDIPAEVKQRLTRRSRKIRQMLGDGVESDLNAIILESKNTAARRLTVSNAYDVKPSGLASNKSDNSNDELDPPKVEPDSLDSLDRLHLFLVDEPNKEATPRCDEDEMDRNLDSKGVKVKRREKLQQILGKGQLPADAPALVSLPSPTRARSMAPTDQARRMRRKQSIKIEKILGEVPSNFKLSDLDRKTLAHQHSIATISMMLQNKDGLSRIMNYLVQEQNINRRMSLPPPLPPSPLGCPMIDNSSRDSSLHSRASISTTDTEQETLQDKLRRQKKFNKLSKFFGGAVDPELLIEQRILSELERKIEEDLQQDDASLILLKENLQSLRIQVKLAVNEISEEDLSFANPAIPQEESINHLSKTSLLEPS